MNTPPKNTLQGAWTIPYTFMTLADGSYLIKPGKPILHASAKQTAKMTNLSPKTLARLAESGFIRVAFPTPRIPQYFPQEVMAFIQKTIDEPNYWTAARRAQYGLARLTKK